MTEEKEKTRRAWNLAGTCTGQPARGSIHNMDAPCTSRTEPSNEAHKGRGGQGHSAGTDKPQPCAHGPCV